MSQTMRVFAAGEGASIDVQLGGKGEFSGKPLILP